MKYKVGDTVLYKESKPFIQGSSEQIIVLCQIVRAYNEETYGLTSQEAKYDVKVLSTNNIVEYISGSILEPSIQTYMKRNKK